MEISYSYLFWKPDTNCYLPDELLDMILSYGDCIVNKKYYFVMKELKDTKEKFYRSIQNNYSIWYQTNEDYFYVYCLRKNYQYRKLKYPFINYSRYLSSTIVDDYLIWLGENYLTNFPLMRNAGFWYDTFPYEPLVDSDIYEIDLDTD